MVSLNVSVDFEVDLEQIAIESAQRLGYDGLKDKQLEPIVFFLATRDYVARAIYI